MLYTSNDTWRSIPLIQKKDLPLEDYRTEWRRDYSRVLHSPSFRRLSKKTQLFPGDESDFFRDRLTHSLEVAQIAKDIAIKLNASKEFKQKKWEVNSDICEIAGLMHDLGHPPFGHNGERALDDCMKMYGGFEGNAQTIRIITRLEKKELLGGIVIDNKRNDQRRGLNLTARVIASALKYDASIPFERADHDKLVKGYYISEKNAIYDVKENVIGRKNTSGFIFKTIECSIMDIADDIAYSTYDIEDAFKAGFLNPLSIMSISDDIIEQIIKKLDKPTNKNDVRIELKAVFGDIWYELINTQQRSIKADTDLFNERTLENFLKIYNKSQSLPSDGYMRTEFTSYLVSKFIDGIRFEINDDFPPLSKVYLEPHVELVVNILKHFAYVALINSSRLKIAEFRGYDIVKRIFETLSNDEKEGFRLLPEDFQELYHAINPKQKNRIVCDFISGMTDRYALEFYCRLFSENPQTIFKPL